MRTFSLDMIPGGAQTAVACNQYEAGDVWVFALYYDGGRYEIPTGAEVSITGTKPDGAAYKIAGTVVSNSVQIVVTDQITACAGRSIAEILVESETDGTTLYSANFPLLVEPAAVQGDLSPSEIPTAITDENGNVYYSAEIAIDDALDADSTNPVQNAAITAALESASGSGGITVVSTAAEMTKTNSVYLYNGTESGYTAGHWYYFNTGASAWTDGGEYTGWETVDTALASFIEENAMGLEEYAIEAGTLTITLGGTTYTYDGSDDVSITLADADTTSY